MSDPKMQETQVNVNARLELLRCLAEWRDILPKFREVCPSASEWQGLDGHTFPPGADFKNPWPDMVVAARECCGIGHIDLVDSGEWVAGPEDWVVKITDAGYDWIRAHDAIGELSHD